MADLLLRVAGDNFVTESSSKSETLRRADRDRCRTCPHHNRTFASAGRNRSMVLAIEVDLRLIGLRQQWQDLVVLELDVGEIRSWPPRISSGRVRRSIIVIAITLEPATMPLCAIGRRHRDGVGPIVAGQIRNIGRIAQRHGRHRPGHVADVVRGAAFRSRRRRLELFRVS